MPDSPAPLSAPRRVLMTADPVGGVWTYMLELVRGLVSAGIEVVVASMGAPVSPAQREAFSRLGDAARLHESTRRLEWMDEPWDDVAADGEWLLGLEGRYRPDLVHLNGYAHAALPWNAPVLVVAHSCVYSWWQAVHGSAPPAAWQRYHQEVARGLRAAGLVVAPSRAMLRQLASHYAAPGPACVIPNGRDPLPVPVPAPDREEAILGVGRLWDAAKNLGALAALAPELPWPVRLAGPIRPPGGEAATLPGVDLLGVLSEAELGAHYARAAIYALPARYEPFGLSVLEAAHAGCALVLGDISSLRENWEGAALFVPPGDSAALREALLRLISHLPLRRRLWAEARARARRLSARRMTEAYLAAYGRLLSTPALQPA